MTSIIVFSGAFGSGKTAGANYLASKYGFRKIAFADELKRLVKLVTPDGQIDKARDRKLLQFLGTEYYRNTIDPDFWVKALVNTVTITSQKPGFARPGFVIDDCRFPNEFEALKGLGAIFLHVLTTPELREQRIVDRDGAFNAGLSNHESEVPLGEMYAHELIYNLKSFENYTTELDNIYALYKDRMNG